MKVWFYVCEECGNEESYSEDEPTEECEECGGIMYNTNDPAEE